MNNVKEYLELVKAPWGKMFYDLLFEQLNISQFPKLKILDFGSGLGVTANHYAALHDVTAIEPNEEMINNSIKENNYRQIQGGIEKLIDFENKSFDIVFCHNVLEYIKNKEPIISELLRVLKSGGILSVVKHNRVGRVIGTAVFKNDPKKALSLLDENANDKHIYLGTQYIYSNDYVSALADENGGRVKAIYGIRAFYALGQDNSVKYTDEWYANMLALENAVANIDDYKNAAFHNHLLIEKTGES
jgi:SAM-dependent methyltransferase